MRYQYTSSGFQKDFYGRDKKFNAVNSIILINTFIYLLTNSNSNIINPFFGINSNNFRLGQLFTYMFLHAGLMHLFFNILFTRIET